MILMDEMIPMKLYSSKQKAYLPFNPTNKRKGSLVTLLTRDIDDSIDLIKMSFFNNPSYYTSYYLDRNVKRYLSNDGNIQIEGEEEDPDVIEEAVMHKINRNSPTITCYGNANDKRLLEKYFTKKAFEKWYDYFNVRKQSRIYPAVYGFNSREEMFKAVGQTAIEKHGQIICNSYNSSTEIVLLNNSEYSITESDGPYAMYCEAAIITFVIHNGFRNATFQLANNMATHLSGQDQWLYAKNDYKSDDKIGMALLIGKYDEKYGRQGMIKLARSGDYYLLVQFGAKNFIDRIAKAAKQESALLESDGTHLDVVRIYKNMSDKDQKFIAVDQRFQNWGPLKDDNCIYRHIERNGLMDVYGFIEAYGDLDNGASIVIGVDPRHRGEGVASKMMEQMLKELPKEHPEIEHLVWRADAKNSKSQKLAEKFGFKLIRKNPLQVVYRKWIKNEREDYKYIDKSVLDEVSLVKWMRSKFEIDEKLNENTTKLRSIKDITHSKKITNMEAGLVVFTALKKMGLNTMMTIFCEHNGSIDTVGQVFPLVMHTYGDWQEETLLVDPFDKKLKSGVGRLKIAQYFEYGEMLHREGRWGVSERPMLFSYNPYEEELKAGNDIYKDILKVQNLTESTLLEFTVKNKIAPPEEMNKKLPMFLSRLKKIKLDDKVIKKYEAHLDGLSHVRTTNNCTGYLWVDPKHKVRMTNLEIPVCYYNVQHKKDENSDTGEIIWIQALEVNPDYQGRGLAKQLLDICINEEHATNLAVNKDNEVAIRLYRSKGFVPYVTNGSMINMQRPIKHESLFISPNDKGVMMVENTMFVFTEELSQTAYNTKLRQYLYKDRLKTTSMQIDIYNRVKSEVPMIRRAYVKPEMYKGLNTFIDLSYYNGLFLKNISYQRDIAIRFYWEYLNRMLKGTDPYFRENYSRNTIFVPVWVGAWDVQKDTYVYDWKANVNPISMIFRMIRRNPAELATLAAYNFIFVGREGYFRVDFSNFSISSLTKFKRNLEKLYNREHISDDEDEDGYGRSPAVGGNADDTTSSTAAISAQIIDKIEDSSGIEINNISAAVGKNKQNLTNLAKPNLNDASALDTIPDMTIISKSVKIPEKNVCIGIMSPGEESMLATMKMTKDIFKNGNFGYLISK